MLRLNKTRSTFEALRFLSVSIFEIKKKIKKNADNY